MKKLNFILQFFFVRIIHCNERVIDGFDITGASLFKDDISVEGKVTSSYTREYYALEGWIIPFKNKPVSKKFHIKLK